MLGQFVKFLALGLAVCGFAASARADDVPLRAVCKTVSIGGRTDQGSNGAIHYGESDRTPCQTVGAITTWRLWFPGQVVAGGHEIDGFNTVFHKATLECPTLRAPRAFTLGGQAIWPIAPSSKGTVTDPLSFSVPAGTLCYARVGTYVVYPPAMAAPTVADGGALAASTYRYEVSCIHENVESGPSAEVTVTTAAGASVGLTWAPSVNPVLPCDGYRIYRTTAGGAPGTESFLGSVESAALGYVDAGAEWPTGLVPQSAQRYPFNNWLTNGASTSGATCGGRQQDVIARFGVMPVVAPKNCPTVTAVVLGDDVATPSIIGLGDSVESGSYIQSAQANFNLSPNSGGWFFSGLASGYYNVLNLSVPSTKIATFVNPAALGGSQRMDAASYGTHIVSDLGINDIANKATWEMVATRHLKVAAGFALAGKKYFITTLTPSGTTIDNGLTQSGFTPAIYEAERDAYNSWVRGPGNGAPPMEVNSDGHPILSGGTQTPYITNYFDLAQAIGEVNAAGVPTMNGDYWPTVPTPVMAGQALLGLPTTQVFTVGSAAYTPHALAGQVLQMTSGAASGQNCIISENTASQIICNVGGTPGLTIAPKAGDSFSYFNTVAAAPPHPSLYGYQQVAPIFAAWAAVNLVQ